MHARLEIRERKKEKEREKKKGISHTHKKKKKKEKKRMKTFFYFYMGFLKWKKKRNLLEAIDGEEEEKAWRSLEKKKSSWSWSTLEGSCKKRAITTRDPIPLLI